MCQNRGGQKSFASVHIPLSKKRRYSVRDVRGFLIPDSIQLGDWQQPSMSSGIGDISHNTFEGKRQVCNIWWNDAKRNANLNWFGNDFNGNYWFAFVRNSLRSSATFVAEVSCCRLRSHPPSILPMSPRGSESTAYCFVSKSFTSQATCKKNLSRSIFPAAFCTKGSFCSRRK